MVGATGFGAAAAGADANRGTVAPTRRERSVRNWSGRLDSNQRPLDPQSSALPGCATPRRKFECNTGWVPRSTFRVPGSCSPFGFLVLSSGSSSEFRFGVRSSGSGFAVRFNRARFRVSRLTGSMFGGARSKTQRFSSRQPEPRTRTLNREPRTKPRTPNPEPEPATSNPEHRTEHRTPNTNLAPGTWNQERAMPSPACA